MSSLIDRFHFMKQRRSVDTDHQNLMTTSSPPSSCPNDGHKDNGDTAVNGTPVKPYAVTDPSSVISPFKLLLLAMMVLQNSSTVLVGRYSRSSVPTEDLYQVNHLLLVIELCKFVASLVLEHFASGGRLVRNLRLHVLDRPADALKITIPALLYLCQNTLLYVALENLTAPIFQVTYQFKLVTTAVMSVFMLQRRYSAQQWVCLVMISLGVAMVVLGERKDTGGDGSSTQERGHVNVVVGLVAVSCACVSSALAGVYFEKVLKKKPTTTDDDDDDVPEASLWMRNVQLAFYSVVIAAVQGWVQQQNHNSNNDAATTTASDRSYFHGFNAWTWTLVALQAGGGLLVAAVIKYADNVLKGLATGVSVVLSSVLSMVLFRTPLGFRFSVGACLILTAVWFFSNPLPVLVSRLFKKDTEMSSLLPM